MLNKIRTLLFQAFVLDAPSEVGDYDLGEMDLRPTIRTEFVDNFAEQMVDQLWKSH